VPTCVVLVLMGLPGSGKSTLAQALAPRLAARVVSRDAIRAALFRPCSFSDREKEAAFEALLRAVAVNCALGHSSVVDGMPFSRVGEYERLEDAARAGGAASVAVLCSVPVAVAQRRVGDQDGHAPDRDDGLVAEVAERFRTPPDGTVEVDGTRPVHELVDRVLGHVGPLLARG
jgi:predicted kinase